MINKVTMYENSVGQTFKSLEDAERTEIENNLFAILSREFPHAQTRTIDFIINNHAVILDCIKRGMSGTKKAQA